MKLKFGQYFAADVWLRLQSWILVNILKLGLVKIFTLDFFEMLLCYEVESWSSFEAKILNFRFIGDADA